MTCPPGAVSSLVGTRVGGYDAPEHPAPTEKIQLELGCREQRGGTEVWYDHSAIDAL